LVEHPHRVAVLAACIAVALGHQLLRLDWTIDDAAIVYAYARNFAAGDGIVPWPGAERIEGFSNPTWFLLLAGLQTLGLSGFQTAKPLAMGLTVITLGLVWRLARAAMPDRSPDAALVAPVLLAISPQWAIWSASGLENALFGTLLAAAVLRTVHEVRSAAFPWSAVVYLLLAWTRPEGVLYAAVGGAWFLHGVRRHPHAPRRVAQWLAVFWIPTLTLEAARIAYFAWPLPNTYYAKVSARGTTPLLWDERGWLQVREYAGRLWHGYFMPLYVAGLVGVRGRRAAAAATLVLGFWIWLQWRAPPAPILTARMVALYLVGALLPALAAHTPGWRTRALCWHAALLGLSFSIAVNGDWMGAYRWMSLIAPVAAVLLGVGIVEVTDAVARWIDGGPQWRTAAWTTVALGIGATVPPSLSQARDHLRFNKDETPEMIRRRAAYLRGIVQRIHHTEVVVHLDMDMGGALWHAPDVTQADMGMLVSIPMARHWYQQRPFIEEHVFAELRPTFAHVHGWWARYSGLPKYDQWQATYFSLPPYEDVPAIGLHEGMWARRDLFLAPRPPGAPIRFEGGVSVFAPRFAAEAWAAGWSGFLALPVAPGMLEAGDPVPHALLFLARDGRVHTWRVPLGHGLLPLSEVGMDEVLLGRHAMPLPPDLTPGVWTLGLVVLGPDGTVAPALKAAPGPPQLAVGEALLGTIRVDTPAAVDHAAERVLARALDRAAAGSCTEAEAAWVAAQHHRPQDPAWRDSRRPEVARAMADCLAGRAQHASDPDTAALLREAHRWDHRSEALARVGAPLAAAWLAEADAARVAEDWSTAYRRYTDVLGFQPWRAWARRYAEQARDHRLGLQDDVRVGRGGADEAPSGAHRD